MSPSLECSLDNQFWVFFEGFVQPTCRFHGLDIVPEIAAVTILALTVDVEIATLFCP